MSVFFCTMCPCVQQAGYFPEDRSPMVFVMETECVYCEGGLIDVNVVLQVATVNVRTGQ
jgi:hypothetical protein